MALGIPNRLIVLGVLAIAFFIPKRAEGAGTAVRSISESLSASFTALGSTKFEPVFNPTVGLSGNIGERIVSRAFGDDPTGEPTTVVTGGLKRITVPGISKPEEIAEAQKPFFDPGIIVDDPSLEQDPDLIDISGG